MDTPTIGRVVLMSIHPIYATAILSGTKRVEFRKRPIANDVTHVFVYATRPVGAIVGAFAVAGQETLSPSNLWESYSEIGGIGPEAFRDYFRSHAKGTSIRVGKVFFLCEHINLDAAFGFRRPPQNFQYVCLKRAAYLLRIMHCADESDRLSNI